MKNRDSAVQWGISEALILAVIIIILELSFQRLWRLSILPQIPDLSERGIHANENILVDILSLLYILLVRITDFTLIVFYVFRVKKGSWNTIGIPARSFREGIRWGVGTCLVFGILVIAAETIYALIYSENLLRVLLVPSKLPPFTNIKYLLLFLIVGGIAAPIVEEIVFRGIIYPPIRSKIGVISGITLNAIIFAAAHGIIENYSVIVIRFIGGVIFSFLYEKTNSILAPVIVHGIGNIAIVGVVLGQALFS